MPESIPDLRVFFAFMAIAMVSSKAPALMGQNPVVPPTAAKPVKVTVTPERFFQIQDSSGFFWQAAGNGALLSGDTQYLQSGLNLIVNGAGFAPTESLVREPGGEKVDLQLSEKRSGILISRNLWFDTRRSAVRVFDTLTNTSNAAQTFPVELRTTYPFSWQSLHGSGGAILSNDPSLQLGARDSSLAVHFSPSEGRHDTLFVVGSEKGGQKPDLKASANSRELTFLYKLVIPPGESRSLLHWILQRSLPNVTEDLAAISPFLQRDKLIAPEVEAKSFPEVVNFAPSSFQVESAAPALIKSLVSLNALTDRIGFHRRTEDILWISPTNQIAGSANRDSVLTVGTTYTGDQDVKVADIAALKGGAGIGRNALVYLRDGRVLAGPIRKGEIKWIATGATAVAPATPEVIQPAELNLLLLATGPGDGAPPAKTTHFLRLIDGTVIAMVNAPGGELTLATPWGTQKCRWSDLNEAVYVSSPSPRFRVVYRNGSETSGFLPVATWSVETPFKQGVEIPSSVVDQLWVSGGAKLAAARPSQDWLDFTEIPVGQGPAGGFLLAGNHLLDGTFADARLSLSDKGKALSLETTTITSMRRSIEPGSAKLIEVELVNGERLIGEFTSSHLRVLSNGNEISIPIEQWLAYRSAPKPVK